MTKPPERLLGIDPSVGGAATLLARGGRLLEIWDIPVVQVGGHRVIDPREWQRIVQWAKPDRAFFELSWAIPQKAYGKGRFMKGQGVVSAGRTQRAHGVLEGILACELAPGELHYVLPQKWKTRFGLIGGEKNKGASRGLATHYFPDRADLFVRVGDDDRAESALIALYGAEHEKMVRLV